MFIIKEQGKNFLVEIKRRIGSFQQPAAGKC